MPPEQTIESRPVDLDHVLEGAAVLRAAEVEVWGEPLHEEQDVDSLWRDPGFDPALDSRCLRSDGTMVAVAATRADGSIVAAVHPDQRGRGHGTRLAEWAEQRQRERGLDSCQQEAGVDDHATARLLEGRGYRVAYDAWELELSPTATIEDRPLPAGVEIRPMRPEEARAVHTLIEDVFGTWEGRRRLAYESWRALLLDRPGRRDDQTLVAVRDDLVVGACVGMDGEDPDDTWVAQLAVHPDERGLGLGQNLLATAFGTGRRHGRPRGRLETDSRTGALSLYERLGMTVSKSFQVRRLDLD